MGLGAVGVQPARFVADQTGGFPSRSAEGHFQRVGVQLDGFVRAGGGGGPTERGVALIAHLLDLRRAFGVGGERGGRDLGGEGEEGPVEAGQVGEKGFEVGERGAEGFGGGVEGEGEKGECLVHCGGCRIGGGGAGGSDHVELLSSCEGNLRTEDGSTGVQRQIERTGG